MVMLCYGICVTNTSNPSAYEIWKKSHVNLEKKSKNITAQAKFVVDLLQGKKNGHYVELGAFHSFDGSNTYHLENDFNYNGVSFEIVDERREEFISNRKNPCFSNALQFDYLSYFEANNFPRQIDYLQVDIDGGYDGATRPYGNRHTPLLGLITLPLTQYRFNVIVFEHDANMYFRNSDIREAQREILDALGYTLVVREIHEDWWVDPLQVSPVEYRKYLRWETLT